ncbi:MAG: PAS domain-containing protein [Chloroflexota bacterium]|nr:PAS domain-containing protein [Chloroflexota bacterium]
MDDRPDDRVRFLRQLVDEAPGLVVLTRGPKHVYAYLNKAALASSAFHPEMIGKTLHEARPELVRQGYEALYDGVFRTGESFVGNDAHVARETANGKPDDRILRFSLTPWRDDEGKVSGVLANAIDVTEEAATRDLQQVLFRQTEELREAAESERRRLLQLLDVIPVGMVIYDRDGKVTAGNKARARIVGDPSRSFDIASSAAYLRLRHPDGRTYTMDELPISRALRGETIRGEKVLIDRVDGVHMVVLVSAAPMRDASGAIDSAVQFYQELDES